MVKKRVSKSLFRDFFLGVLIFLIVQTVFMLGGWYVEKFNSILITGIPSAIGLTVLLLVGLYLKSKKGDYFFYGLFAPSFLAPLIIFMISISNPDLVSIKLASYVSKYMAILILIVYVYIISKLWKN